MTAAWLESVVAERRAQDAWWGEQNHPDGTDAVLYGVVADEARELCQAAARSGEVTWAHVLKEEVYEALAEEDPARLSAELLQVAAVAVAWIEAIERREQP